MASSFAYQQRGRQHAAPARHEEEEDALDDATASEPGLDGGAVLLFAPPPSSHSATVRPAEGSQASSDAGDTLSSEWNVLPAFVRSSAAHAAATQHHAASTSSSAASDTTSSAASPTLLNRSLFPSHDGNGIFLADSLVLSEAPSQYAPIETDFPSEDDSNPTSYTSSDGQSSSSHSRFVNSRRSRRRERELESSRHTAGPPSVGGSWALTEAALSTIPDAEYAVNFGASIETASAGFTSDSSEDESVEGLQARGADEEHEEMMSTTPHAESAGLGSTSRSYHRRRRATQKEQDAESSRSREAYPTPPPESRRSKVKRRHRQSGRAAGSQKRSSTSGSVSRISYVPLPVEYPTLPVDLSEDTPVFGGLLNIDRKTGELLVGVMHTPPTSREATPVNYTRHSFPRTARRQQPHGFVEALRRHAHFEIDGGEGQFNFHLDDDLDMNSGDETETEHRPQLDHQPSTNASTPPGVVSTLFESRSFSSDGHAVGQAPLRSHSTSSLPKFLRPLAMRRSSSFSSTSRHSDAQGGAGTNQLSDRQVQESPWGGELEGIEAALSYWRRILSRMRGH